MLNIQENNGADDFTGKCLAFFMRRNQALGIRLAHGRIGDVAYLYARQTIPQQADSLAKQWGVIAAALHALIQMKVERIEEITEILNKERYNTIEEAHILLRESIQLNEEIEPLKDRLLEMATYG